MKTNFTKRLLSACRLATMVVAMISAIGISEATAQNQSCYVCTSGSNTTLDENCEAVVSVRSFIKAPCVGNVIYTLEVVGVGIDQANGRFAPGTASVTITEPGTYTYIVSGVGAGPNPGPTNSCWGTFSVEDKSGPVCLIPTPVAVTDTLATKFISCEVDDLTGILDTLDETDFLDCSGNVVDVYFVDEEVSGCGPIAADSLGQPSHVRAQPANTSICAIYKRTWFAVDGQGKVSADSCSQYVYALIADPVMISITTPVTVDCDSTSELTNMMAPTIPNFDGSGTIKLLNGEKVCGKYIATVNMGEKLETCGSGYKQINHWSVIDWCLGTIVLDTMQLVVVEDNDDPTTTAKGSISFAADPFDCSGVITVGAATGDDNCSPDDLSWTTSIVATGGGGHTGSGDVSTVLSTNGGMLANVPIGSEVVVSWVAIDDCGNQSAALRDTFKMTIDNRAPSAVCNDELNVTLVATNDGPRARIYAVDVDNGSSDNCGISSVQISRDGETYADYLTVNCDDAPSITVYLRVTDTADDPATTDVDESNSNVCWTTITVEDKSIPVVTAPAGFSVSCLVGVPAYDDTDAAQRPVIVSTGCTNPEINFITETRTGLSCGNDVAVRSWEVIPARTSAHTGASPDTVYQTITVIPADPEWKFSFPPSDLDLTCDGDNTVPDQLELEDIQTIDNTCNEWLLRVADKEYTAGGDICKKIIRTYTVINWCVVEDDPGREPAIINRAMVDQDSMGVFNGGQVLLETHGIFSYTQVFKISDTEAPTATITATPSCDNSSEDCNGGIITVAVNDVADNCGTASVLRIDVTGASGSQTADDAESGMAEFTGLAAGTYSVSATIIDGCGNQSLVSTSVTVIGDCKKPTPVGVFTFTALMESDSVDIWVSDIETSSYDHCTGREGLKFGIELMEDVNGDGEFTGADLTGIFPDADYVTLTCDKIELTAAALWVMDGAGNMQFTIVPIGSTDNDNSCSPADEAANIEGSIVDESEIEIEEVMVKFEGTQLSAFEQLFNGIYNYSVPMHSDVTITPEKDLGHMNGITTADIVKLQRHILGIEPLTSSYKLIAADVSADDKVNTKDMLHLSRLILGIYDELPNVNSWRFVDKNHNFANPSSPWGFPEVINYADLSSDAQADFIGIKIGDLTGNAKASNLLGTEDNKVGAMTIAIDESKVVAGTIQEIEFTAKNFNDFAGYQFSIALAEGVSFEGVEVGSLPNHTEANFGLSNLDDGVITTNWANAESVNLEDGEVLFTLSISSTSTMNISEAISINSVVTAAEAYDNELEAYDIDVQFNRTAAAFTLFQNTPNPFSDETMVGFNLPTAGAASLKVMDVSGRVLKSYNGTYTAGFHQITINKRDLGSTGVLYYQLDTDAHSATKKMVILE